MNRVLLCTIVAWTLLAAVPGMAQKESPTTAPADRLAIADPSTGGLVVVEYTLQFDKGEAPSGRVQGVEKVIREERPLEVEGWLVGETEVVTRDALIHPRFIKSIAVRFGGKTVAAKVAGYYKNHAAVLLKLDGPLADAKPLAFHADAKGPFYYVDYTQSDGHWTIAVIPIEMPAVCRNDAGRKFISTNAIYSLIVDKKGQPVALQVKGEFPMDDSWKGSPLDWPMDAQAAMDKIVKDLSGTVDTALLRVKLHFRSPRKEASRDSSSAGPTEHTCAGLLVAPNKLVVLVELEAKLTGRLERVDVYPTGSSEPVPATFAGTMTDYGCFLATFEKPLPGEARPAKLATAAAESLRDRLLVSVDMRLEGDQRVVYYLRDRLSRFELGWKHRIYPEDFTGGFLFDPADSTLVVLPVAHRQKVAVRDRYNSSDRAMMMPAGYFAEAVAEGAKALDPSNVPLTEDQENRLAWLGLEFQAMNLELARANKVSDETHNGRIGARVSYVYPGSPADKAGVQPDWILIRIQAPDQPKPIDVQLEYFTEYVEDYPWDKWDKLPEAYYDRIPPPWPPLENSISRTLTDLGFGKPFTAYFWVDGKMVAKEFVIEQSPQHFGTAPRYAVKPIGLTVRNMTYEVRRYFNKKPDDPGVIVSKIEPGGKASVAGVKPFEIITHVNDNPVKNVKEFEKQVTDTTGELRLTIRRMARGRLVKMDLAAASQPDEATGNP
jgi:hypothetical protein